MGNTMLIDAAHPEETRVVVVRGNRIEEFDYESAERKQLKGNIYLAKVTRVEPSLQAAFVDYGGNRHGFLAFSEIHPDYYQIPVADRQALLEEERADEQLDNHDLDTDEENGKAAAKDATSSDGDDDADEDSGEDDSFDSVGAEDALEEVPTRQRRHRRSYKIQEVIKRRQVILIQVVKEERGNKGAALTTYLSLAGRYCVLMPNTARGGGISRKITEAGDRKRLKEVARELKVPEGMGLIVRTAGAKRTKAEIKRDFDYLLRLWESVRDLTLKSTAPTVVYEEGNLIKRSIRDLYNKEIDEVLVEGDEALKEAKGFMKMLMPSHARNVKAYKETRPLFSQYKVEGQLDSLFSPVVPLKSGGYMVMNQTEALVAVDINSGKATREHNIEDTALKTNLEAASEIARQLRLRDLAGLIVIDFIDMEEKRNNRSVERKLKEALKNDRARIQVGRISHFGLLEMSRQRLRQGMLENSTMQCEQCQGTGLVRSLSSCALSVLRGIEEHLISRKPDNLTVRCDREVAFYILNDKRDHLLALENNYGISIYLETSQDMRMADFEIIRSGGEKAGRPVGPAKSVKIDTAYDDADEDGERAADARSEDEDADGQPRKRKRRRGRRGGRRSRERGQSEEQTVAASEDGDAAVRDDQAAETPAEATADDGEGEEEAKPKSRRGGRRRSRASKSKAAASEETAAESSEAEAADEPPAPAEEVSETAEPAVVETAEDSEAAAKAEKPKRARKPRKAARKKAAAAESEPEAAVASAPQEAEAPDAVAGNGGEVAPDEAEAQAGNGDAEAEPARSWTPPEQTAPTSGPRKSGWWSKR